MATRPSAMSRSAPRRLDSPACARILLSLSFAIGRDRLRCELWNPELALDLRQVRRIAQAEGDEELARRLVHEGTAGRLLAPRDADESPLEEIVQRGLGVHAAHGVDLGPGHRLLVGDDGQRLEGRA